MKTVFAVLFILLACNVSSANSKKSTTFSIIIDKTAATEKIVSVAATQTLETDTGETASCKLDLEGDSPAINLETTDILGNKSVRSFNDIEVITALTNSITFVIINHRLLYLKAKSENTNTQDVTSLVVEVNQSNTLLRNTLDATLEAKRAGNLDPLNSSIIRSDVAVTKMSHDNFDAICATLMGTDISSSFMSQPGRDSL